MYNIMGIDREITKPMLLTNNQKKKKNTMECYKVLDLIRQVGYLI